MRIKNYKDKIKTWIIIISLVPVLFFAILFSKNIHGNRVDFYVKNNQNYLNEKINMFHEEIVTKFETFNDISNSLYYYIDNPNYSLDQISNNFKEIYPYFKTFKISKLNYDEKEIILNDEFTYSFNSEVINISKSIKNQNGLNLFLEGSIDYKEFFKWFKKYSADTYVSIKFGDTVFYQDKEVEEIKKKFFNKFFSSKNYENLDISIAVYKGDEVLDLLNDRYREHIIKIAFLIFLSAIGTYILSNNLNYPFSKIKIASKKIIDGEYSVRVEEDDELLELTNSFNNMAEKNEKMNQEFVNYAFTMLEKNDKLAELNLQLEASYDQLKALTEMLEFSENKYSALFDNINDFIWTCDKNDKITYVNDHMCQTLDYTRNELVGTPLDKIFINVDDSIDLTKRDYQNINILMKAKNREEIMFSANSKRLFKSGKLIGSQGTARSIIFEEVIQSRILRKNIEFEIVKEIIFSLAKVKTLKDLMNTVAKNVNDLFSPELCTIRIYENGYLNFFTKTGKFKEYSRDSNFHIDEDCSGDAVKENKIIKISNFENSIFANREELEPLLQRVSEIITIPITIKNEIFGTIHICVAEKLKDSDMKLLRTLANQTSIAVDKVKLYDSLKEDYLNTIRVLASAVEAKDKYTEGHSLRVSKLSQLIGKEIGLNEEELEEIEITGTLHDIGKIGIDDEILTKNGALSMEEYLIIKGHPTIGEKILRPIGLSKNIMEGVFFHHKRYDLKGYPEESKISELGIFPSIIGVADALDAMTSNRTYANARSIDEALNEIVNNSGTQFNPFVVSVLSDIVNIKRKEILMILEL